MCGLTVSGSRQALRTSVRGTAMGIAADILLGAGMLVASGGNVVSAPGLMGPARITASVREPTGASAAVRGDRPTRTSDDRGLQGVAKVRALQNTRNYRPAPIFSIVVSAALDRLIAGIKPKPRPAAE